MTDCSCNGNTTENNYSRCSLNCDSMDISGAIQKVIQNQVRVPSSLYTMNLAALNIRGSATNNPLAAFAFVNQSQASDRNIFHIPTRYVPTRGNSTRGSITRVRPGSLGPSDSGVDVKHNSYDRYLGRLKSQNIKTEVAQVLPVMGNKTRKWGLANSDSCNC